MLVIQGTGETHRNYPEATKQDVNRTNPYQNTNNLPAPLLRQSSAARINAQPTKPLIRIDSRPIFNTVPETPRAPFDRKPETERPTPSYYNHTNDSNATRTALYETQHYGPIEEKPLENTSYSTYSQERQSFNSSAHDSLHRPLKLPTESTSYNYERTKLDADSSKQNIPEFSHQQQYTKSQENTSSRLNQIPENTYQVEKNKSELGKKFPIENSNNEYLQRSNTVQRQFPSEYSRDNRTTEVPSNKPLTR
jgi:hypothetical protein